MLKRSIILAVPVIAVCFHSSTACASGFGIFTQGAEALGQANAVVAGGTGPTSIFFNPALLTFAKGTAVEFGTTAIFPRRETTDRTSGELTNTKDSAYFPSTAYFTHSSGKWAAGLGIFNPFGLGTDWGNSWEGRYLATKSKITTFEINPVIACQVVPGVSVAAGFEYVLLKARLKSKVNLIALGLPDAEKEISGSGDGIGYNVAVAARHGDVGLGASYRSKKKVSIKGDIDFTNPVPAVDAVLPDTSASTTITLPQQLHAGISYNITAKTAVEAGVRWEDWSSTSRMRFRFGKNVGVSRTASEKKNWHDTMAYNIGINHKVNGQWAILGGYLYGENAVPDATIEPAVPDSNSHLFCLGTKFKLNRFVMSLGYGLQLQNDRTKNNSAGGFENNANGEYRSTLHLVAASIGYHF